MTTLSELRAAGAFVSKVPVPQEIKFTLGDTGESVATVHVRMMSVGDLDRISSQQNEEGRFNRSARIVSELVSLGDGTERISFDEALEMHPAILTAMMAAVDRVNGTAKRKN